MQHFMTNSPWQAEEVEGLRMLSMANVRKILQAVLPLPRLTPEKATEQVIEHLINRTRSRKSRLKHAADPAHAPPRDGDVPGTS